MKILFTSFLLLFAITTRAQKPTATDLLNGLFSGTTPPFNNLPTADSVLKGQNKWKVDYFKYNDSNLTISYTTMHSRLWKKMINDFTTTYGFIGKGKKARWGYTSASYPKIIMEVFRLHGKNNITLTYYSSCSGFIVGYNLLLKSFYCNNNQHCMDSLFIAEKHPIASYPYMHPPTLNVMLLDSVWLNYNPNTQGYRINLNQEKQNNIISKFQSDYDFVLSYSLPDSVSNKHHGPDTITDRKYYISADYPDIEVISYRTATAFTIGGGEQGKAISGNFIDYCIEVKRKTNNQ